ncbi:hypothetical protein BC834DRAFT_1030811 [Gloeopeniophorella convolvens]|nr:hypothetical protein BC834DRAFT_1030811 [Gloeopeniophorella convolvens]
MPPPPAHYNVYREQLASLYHGCALWEPDPANIYDCVQVGDVGYLSEGYFFRMFNVLLPADDPSNQTLGNPSYEPLNLGPFANIRESRLSQGDYYSRNVSTREHNIGAQAQVPGAPAGGGASVAYRCRRKLGASLKLPFEARRADAIRTKAFEDYTRDNCDNWLAFAQRNRLGVERMEDIILVSGCTVASAWAATAFVNEDMDAEITLSFQAFGAAGANFGWHVGQESVQSVAYHNSRELVRARRRLLRPRACSGGRGKPDPPQNQCVFIRGFRAKRILGFFTRARAAAEPLPDDPDNEPETGPAVSVSRIPDVPAWRDPLVGVLDYIAEKCPDQQIAIAHDDDLQLIEEVETLTADAVENFLRQNEIGVLVENGAAILVADEENEVPEDTKAIFYARAETEGELLPLVVHPVLLKYLLKLDPATQPPEHDFDLPPKKPPRPRCTRPCPHCTSRATKATRQRSTCARRPARRPRRA